MNLVPCSLVNSYLRPLNVNLTSFIIKNNNNLKKFLEPHVEPKPKQVGKKEADSLLDTHATRVADRRVGLPLGVLVTAR